MFLCACCYVCVLLRLCLRVYQIGDDGEDGSGVGVVALPSLSAAALRAQESSWLTSPIATSPIVSDPFDDPKHAVPVSSWSAGGVHSTPVPSRGVGIAGRSWGGAAGSASLYTGTSTTAQGVLSQSPAKPLPGRRPPVMVSAGEDAPEPPSAPPRIGDSPNARHRVLSSRRLPQ